MDLVAPEVAQLVQTPRTLDKTWSRLLRGDRGCAFDAMSLIGAICTITAVSLARMELWPWFPVYISAGTWLLGFGLGTRAQLRSGRKRRLALTEGPLVALGVVDAEASLQRAEGVKARVGRALVLLPRGVEQSSIESSAQDAVSQAAHAVKQGVDTGSFDTPEVRALVEDRFSFERVVLPDSDFRDWVLTRVILQTDRLGKGVDSVGTGAVVWAIYHEETDILEQALL